MGESLQSIPPDTRKKLPAPPLPPEGADRLGIDLGAFSASFRGSGSARSLIERPTVTTPTTRSGHDTPASAAATVADPAITVHELHA